MSTATITLWVIAVGLLIYAWRRGDNSLRQGTLMGWQTLRRSAALLVAAFIIVGYVNVLSPTNLVQEWIGPNSGWQGLILAEIIGMLLPGGPYVIFPLIAVIYQSGAGLGPAVAIITSWATQSLLTITFELPFMGWRFTAIRWGLGLGIPLLAGGAAQLFFGG
ncbi:MAG: permease [Chloroflexi bacterium]|nr:permease [Chloroflexota bacterium]MBU1661502.1 permease [Chloroflexota bacterium]